MDLTKWVTYADLPALLQSAIGSEIHTRDPYAYGLATVSVVEREEGDIILCCTDWRRWYTASNIPWRTLALVSFVITENLLVGVEEVAPGKFYIAFKNCNGITFRT